MHKIAIFVEGETEELFIEHLIQEIANVHSVVIERKKVIGGKKVPKQIFLRNASSPNGSEQYYVLIMNCGGDHLVAQRIHEEHNNLTSDGYSKIIGIRDVRPSFGQSDIHTLASGLMRFIDTNLIPVEFILSVMEIEAWFLTEHSHFSKIDSSITNSKIKTELGLDVENDDLSLRTNPAVDINLIYQLASKTYDKPPHSTLAVLDYGNLYIEMPSKIPYLKNLINCIDTFLSKPPAGTCTV